MENKNEFGGQMLGKVFAILEFVAAARTPVRAQEISAYLRIPQSTTLRYLNSMIHYGYMYQDEYTQRYALTWKICKLNGQLNTPLAAKNIVSPYVSQLSQKLNYGAAAMIAREFDGIYIDLIDDPSTILTSMMTIGTCPPLNATASGKILLSRYSDQKIEEFIDAKGLIKRTEKTIDDKDRLLEELKRVRAQGYATEIDECTIGVECVAVPIYDYNDEIYMALSVFNKACITEPKLLHEVILPRLFESAREVSQRFGCSEEKLASYII